MSGPVWRSQHGPVEVCDQCLTETERVMVEGTVAKAVFHPERRLCERCYADNIALIAREV